MQNLGLNKKWSLFPSTTTIAYYDTHAQFIELSKISSTDMIEALSRKDTLETYRKLPVLFHEIQHWLDHTSTLWGVGRALELLLALDARLSSHEARFWQVRAYHNSLRRDRRGEYFTTLESTSPPAGTGDKRWRAVPSMGYEFDNNGHLNRSQPVFFVSFAWANNERICRVPMTVSALLETTATSCEVMLKVQLLELLDDDAKAIETRVFGRETVAQVYEPELGLYSAAAHLTANHLQESDVLKAYNIAAKLASVALNLPSKCFDQITVPNAFREQWGEGNDWALRNRDRAYAFMALLAHAPRQTPPDLSEWIASALVSAGLPDLAGLESMSRAEISDLIKGFRCSHPIIKNRFEQFGPVVKANCEALPLAFEVSDILRSFSHFYCCPILTSDGEWAPIGRQWGRDEVEFWHEVTSKVGGAMEEFVAACF